MGIFCGSSIGIKFPLNVLMFLVWKMFCSYHGLDRGRDGENMRISICDDEAAVRELIASKVQRLCPGAGIIAFCRGFWRYPVFGYPSCGAGRHEDGARFKKKG